MGKLPAFQFYTGDWLKDPALTLCTPAARGVWMDLICAMHESDRSGKLCGTREQLARVARCSTVEFAQALSELQATGAADVTERNGAVTVENRRMKREAKSRIQTKKRVFKHRHPQDTKEGNGDVTPKKHRSSSSSSDPPVVPRSDKPPEFKPNFQTLCKAFGIDTPSMRDESEMYEAWLELWQKRSDVGELQKRIAIYRRKYPGYPVTRNAVFKNWHTLKEEAPAARLQSEPETNLSDWEIAQRGGHG